MTLATVAAKNALAAAYATAAKNAALYSTVPGAAAGTELTDAGYARVPLTWSAPVAGVVTATATFDIAAGTTVRGAGVHTADGDYLDGWAVTEQAFGSAGKYTLTLTYTQS